MAFVVLTAISMHEIIAGFRHMSFARNAVLDLHPQIVHEARPAAKHDAGAHIHHVQQPRPRDLDR